MAQYCCSPDPWEKHQCLGALCSSNTEPIADLAKKSFHYWSIKCYTSSYRISINRIYIKILEWHLLIHQLRKASSGISSRGPEEDFSNNLHTNQEPGVLGCWAQLRYFCHKEAGPAQGHEGLKGARRHTCRPGVFCPGLRGETTDSPHTLQHQEDRHNSGEQMYGVV